MTSEGASPSAGESPARGATSGPISVSAASSMRSIRELTTPRKHPSMAVPSRDHPGENRPRSIAHVEAAEGRPGHGPDNRLPSIGAVRGRTIDAGSEDRPALRLADGL